MCIVSCSCSCIHNIDSFLLAALSLSKHTQIYTFLTARLCISFFWRNSHYGVLASDGARVSSCWCRRDAQYHLPADRPVIHAPRQHDHLRVASPFAELSNGEQKKEYSFSLGSRREYIIVRTIERKPITIRIWLKTRLLNRQNPLPQNPERFIFLLSCTVYIGTRPFVTFKCRFINHVGGSTIGALKV